MLRRRIRGDHPGRPGEIQLASMAGRNSGGAFINACVQQESRAKTLADHFLSLLNKPFEELWLDTIPFPVADRDFLIRRDQLIQAKDYGGPLFDLARQFAAAEDIVIAARFWDLSFPAALKQYFEQINVLGITFSYTPEGVPQGLYRAKSFTYVTTAGGGHVPDDFGFGYVKALAQGYYGIRELRQFKAIGLDIDGVDVDAISQSAMDSMA